MSAGHPHMQDFEGHVEAVAADYEYFRRKRIEPRVLLYLRRGIIGWSDLFTGHEQAGPPSPVETSGDLAQHPSRPAQHSVRARRVSA